MILSVFLLAVAIFHRATVAVPPNHRTKCTVECFVECLRLGIDRAAFCGCDIQSTYRSCNSINEFLLNAETVDEVLPVRTEYRDSRSITISMSALPNAFMYIFEFSTVSIDVDNWTFAGASTAPSITFTVPESCKDYQFRVIVVQRPSPGRQRPIAVFRARAIPFSPPDFAVDADTITATNPVFNRTDETVEIVVSWRLPRGYQSSDVHGYERPAVYPLQCLTPEDELPQPVVLGTSDGGAMLVKLPASILEGRCRIWVEVQVMPRCARLQPFSVGRSLELDCGKLPTLPVCRDEIGPQCTEVIDVWGKDGNATVMWQPPAEFGEPLYYHIRYGQAQMQGVPPFVSWKIASRRDVRTSGSQRELQVPVQVDADYGVQICAIYNQHRTRPNFGVIRVTPFICTSCKQNGQVPNGRCGECSKIEGPLLVGRRCNANQACSTIANGADVKKDSDNEADAAENGISFAGSVLGVGEDVNISRQAFAVETTTFNAYKTTSTPTTSSSTTAAKTTVDVNQTLHFTESTAYKTTTAKATSTDSSAPTTTTTTTSFAENALIFGGTSSAFVTSPPTRFFETSSKLPNDEPMPDTSLQLGRISDTSTGLGFSLPRTGEVRKHEPNKKSCTLSNGVICDFGCKPSRISCICPMDTHALTANGACIGQQPRSEIGSSKTVEVTTPQDQVQCLPRRELNVSFDRLAQSLRVFSPEVTKVFDAIGNPFDSLFVEFGQIHKAKPQTPDDYATLNYAFESETRKKKVVLAEKIRRSSLFNDKPFVLPLNQPLHSHNTTYGIRMCAYNSKTIGNPLKHDWDAKTGNSGDASRIHNVMQILQMDPPTDGDDELRRSSPVIGPFLAAVQRSAWVTVPLLGAAAVILLIACGVYLNSARLRRFYDRRRTRRFSPFYAMQRYQRAAYTTSASRGTAAGIYPHYYTGKAQNAY